MRVYRKDEFVIRFVRDVSTTDCRLMALEISKRFEELADSCDNKTQSVFPTDVVREIVELCNDLKESTPCIDIPVDYGEYVRSSQDVMGYFTRSYEDMMNEEARIIGKRNMFGIFRSMLERMGQIQERPK